MSQQGAGAGKAGGADGKDVHGTSIVLSNVGAAQKVGASPCMCMHTCQLFACSTHASSAVPHAGMHASNCCSSI